MDLSVFAIAVSVLALLVSFYALFKSRSQKEEKPVTVPETFNSIPLRLQA
ncbi:MAG: hypothetical protein IPP93_11495 [Chitinophagaceae bacterium]|nr:hypothetical protein [Chitinophagaceae bacterium]